jgi:kynurenine 3-monooxygenase
MDKTIAHYGSIRKIDTDAIADLAIDNFFEMRDHVANPVFQRKRKIEMQLEGNYPDYLSKYSMVTFNEQIPYSTAMNKGRQQDKVLMDFCEKVEDVDKVDLEEVYNQLKTIN